MDYNPFDHFAQIEAKLAQIAGQLHNLAERQHIMLAQIEALAPEVAAIKTAVTNAIALINRIPQLGLSPADAAALTQVTTDLHDHASALQAAVTANTPAA